VQNCYWNWSIDKSVLRSGIKPQPIFRQQQYSNDKATTTQELYYNDNSTLTGELNLKHINTVIRRKK